MSNKMVGVAMLVLGCTALNATAKAMAFTGQHVEVSSFGRCETSTFKAAPAAKAPVVSNRADVITPTVSQEHAQISLASWSGWLDWSRWWNWIGNWVNIAWQKIGEIPDGWRRWVVTQGLRMGLAGVSAEAITAYYRSQGQYCPDRPWWLPLPWWLKPAWPILTCAEHAR